MRSRNGLQSWGAILLAVVGLGGIWLATNERKSRLPVEDEPTVSRDDSEERDVLSRPVGSRRPTFVDDEEQTKGLIEGRVIDDEGEGVLGALVIVERVSVGERAARGSTEMSATRTDGRFSIELESGEYVLYARHDEMSSERTRPILLRPRRKVEGVQLALGAAASLHLTVRDAADGHAVPKCVVRSGEGVIASECDHAGRVRLEPLAMGATVIRVVAPGYVPFEKTVVLTRRGVTTAEISLSRGSVIEGRVVDPDGRPVPRARVWTTHYALGDTEPPSVFTATDGRGDFVLDGVPSGRTSVRASAEGWAEARSPELRLGVGERRTGLELVLTTGGAIAGRVLTVDDDGIAGATVEAIRPADPSVVVRDVTAPDGSYRLDGLESGTYTISATGKMGQVVVSGVEVLTREEKELDLRLENQSISGHVLDAKGDGIADAWVAIASQQASGLGERATMTDRNGGFSVAGLSGEPFRVTARAEGRGSAELRGVQTGQQVEIVLEGQGGIEGVVSSDTGFDTDAFEVTVVPDGPIPPGGMAGRYRVLRILSPDGSFSVEGLPVGRYRIRARGHGHMENGLVAEVTADRVEHVILRLERGRAVTGFVRREGMSESGCSVMGRESSGTDGSFRVGGLPPGSVFVWVRCVDGAAGGVRADLSNGDANGLEISIRPIRVNQEDLDFGGIGASLHGGNDGRIIVAGVFEGGPAFRAGIQRGDEILFVDGWSATGQTVADVVARIRGPIGQPVVLDMKRGMDGVVTRTAAERSRIALN